MLKGGSSRGLSLLNVFGDVMVVFPLSLSISLLGKNPHRHYMQLA